MELVKILPDNIRTNAPAINVNHKGYFRFSTGLVREVDLREGDQLSLYQDKDRASDWYFKKEKDGSIKLRHTNNKIGGLIAQSSSLAKKLLKSIGIYSRGASIPVAVKPVEGGYYAILTKGLKTKQQ